MNFTIYSPIRHERSRLIAFHVSVLVLVIGFLPAHSEAEWRVSIWARPYVSTDWSTPGSICLDGRSGEMYLTDAHANRVRILDSLGFERYSFSSASVDPRTGLPNGQPHDIAVTPGGDIYMTDFSDQRISLLDFRGEAVDYIDPALLLGRKGARIRAENLALGKDGLVYATTSGDATGIMGFDEFGNLVRAIAYDLAPACRINQPSALAVDADGSLWVTDQQGFPVVKHYSTAGEYLGGFGGREMAHTDFSYPSDILVARDGTLWIADALRQAVKHFTRKGEFIEFIGGFGVNPGEMQNPVALAGDGVEALFVGERAGRRIQKFSPGGQGASGG
jgi:streptogramin lyase